MRRSTLAALVTAGLAACAVVLAPSATGPAVAAQTELCEKYEYAFVSDDRFVVSNQVWGATTPQCVTARDGGFTIASEAHDNPPTDIPAAYPDIFAGCHWARCTRGSGLPMAMSDPRFASITTGVDVTVPEGAGIYNVAYDAWFDPTPRTDGQQTGAELMIWLEHEGGVQPVGVPVGTVELAGATWQVWFGTSGWNVVSYVRTTPTRSIDLVFSDFTSDAIARGYMEEAWYLTNIQAGFEVWRDVVGLSVDDFRYAVDLEATPSPTPTPSPTCVVEATVVSRWPDGFQGSITLRNTGPAAWDRWVLSVPERPGQSVTQVWNASLLTGAGALTFRDAGWNGRVPPGGTTQIGFLGRLAPGQSFDVTGATVDGTACGT